MVFFQPYQNERVPCHFGRVTADEINRFFYKYAFK